MILPGETLGILGGGQLGRMFTVAALTMGYRVMVLDPDPDSPAGALASEHICAGYTDEDALRRLSTTCSAVTTEFENVPASSLEMIAKHIPVHPSANIIRIARDRILEKKALRDIGLSTADYHVIKSTRDITPALEHIQLPAILKTATLGYDGKGQETISEAAHVEEAFKRLGSAPCVLEERVDLAAEISVILARGESGSIKTYPPSENIHRDGILELSIVPARIPEELQRRAVDMACDLASALAYCGVLAVEFFVDRNGRLLINEIAPRPHNSGHFTLDACVTDQFQQQVLTLCGFDPAETRLLSSAVMVNILGDAWKNGEPAWESVLNDRTAHLHLYGKKEPRCGRKMGHITCTGDDIETLIEKAKYFSNLLTVNC
jgi:5-(carboxyamino)imidazole ribonucleotide synthase